MSTSAAEPRWSTLPPTNKPASAGAKPRSHTIALRFPRARSRAALVPITLVTLFMYWTVVNPI